MELHTMVIWVFKSTFQDRDTQIDFWLYSWNRSKYWFLAKIVPNFVSLPLKLDNQYYHTAFSLLTPRFYQADIYSEKHWDLFFM